MTTLHFLKSTPDAYRKVASGEKTLEVRKDDRSPRYKTGDIVVLECYRPLSAETDDGNSWTYQGEHQVRRIGYVERGEHVPSGYCSFALQPAEDDDWNLIEQFPVKTTVDRGRRCRLRLVVSQ